VRDFSGFRNRSEGNVSVKKQLKLMFCQPDAIARGIKMSAKGKERGKGLLKVLCDGCLSL
jgi:hypothetical protein